MRRGLSAALVLSLLACGKTEEPKKAQPDPVKKTTTNTPPKVTGDADGTYACLKCGVKWKEPKCKGCGEDLKSSSTSSTNTSGTHSGGTAVAASFKCPKCNFTDPRKGKCMNHGDTDMKECWYVCDPCGAKEPDKGKCKKCGKDLTEKLVD